MTELYLIITVVLFALAISDLIVGVSNDAVNFLNSAIGSKVASRNVIMIVASAGIFVGATFSSGMMEVARKGIFNPDFFFFSEIMIIFLAVMLTDIILLDLFNTFGMPTSTTVSIVFELLGAAVAVSLLKILGQGDSIATLSDYINTSSALAIISGIFLSIGVAFFVGTIIQYFSRLLFSFHFEKRMRWVGSLWSGLALAALTYFLLIKGVKGASFVSGALIDWVMENTLLLLIISFGFWTLVMQLLLSVFKVNILRLVVLFGTFSLAMAFAGNDLVNFIGVPIAGFESFNAWSASGIPAEEYSMEVLKQPVRTKTYLLLIAGLIMIVTLWLSKKAQSVTETEVNLGRQSEGSERFSSNMLARNIVWITRKLGMGTQKLLPKSWRQKADENFEPDSISSKKDKPGAPAAFDLVRASVNLTVASMLIAFATSLKLPLSTTYVSFMVAMGTSLADRAWGRDSAVYRIAGVLNVIGGWFLTAFIAFTVSGIFAFLIFQFGIWAIASLVVLAILFISRTFLLHRKREQEKQSFKEFEQEQEAIPASTLIEDTAKKVRKTLKTINQTYRNALRGLVQEDMGLLRKAWQDMEKLKRQNENLKFKLYGAIKRLDENQAEASRTYLLVYDLEQDMVQSIYLIVDSCYKHVANSLNPLAEEQIERLQRTTGLVNQFFEQAIDKIKEKDFSQLETLFQEKEDLLLDLENTLIQQTEGIKSASYGMRNSMLFFSIQLETIDLVSVVAQIIQLYARVQLLGEEHTISLIADK